jgi:hypothetical protein
MRSDLHASVSGLRACLSFTTSHGTSDECPITDLEDSRAGMDACCKCARHIITAVTATAAAVTAAAVTAAAVTDTAVTATAVTGVLVTTARLVLTANLLASLAIAIGGFGQPCNPAIMSRNHFAVAEMELRNDVNDLTTEYLLLAVARIRNGTHTFGIAVRVSMRAIMTWGANMTIKIT